MCGHQEQDTLGAILLEYVNTRIFFLDLKKPHSPTVYKLCVRPREIVCHHQIKINIMR